jgi:hypothetical protein
MFHLDFVWDGLVGLDGSVCVLGVVGLGLDDLIQCVSWNMPVGYKKKKGGNWYLLSSLTGFLAARPFFLGDASSPSTSCFLAARFLGVFLGVTGSPSSPVVGAAATAFFLRAAAAFLGVGAGEAPSGLDDASLALILAQALPAERGLDMPAKPASFS